MRTKGVYIIFAIALIGLWSVKAPVHAGVLQADFTFLFNVDGVVNNGAGLDFTQAFLDDPVIGRNALATDSAAFELDPGFGNGLPNDGFFAANVFHPEVQLGWHNNDYGDNVLLIAAPAIFGVDVPRLRYRFLHLFASSTEGSSNIRVDLIYEDGSRDIFLLTVFDWLTEIDQTFSRYTLIDGLDLVNAPTMTLLNINDAAIFGHVLSANPNRTLNSIQVEFLNGGRLVVFGAALESVDDGQPDFFARFSTDSGCFFSASGD